MPSLAPALAFARFLFGGPASGAGTGAGTEANTLLSVDTWMCVCVVHMRRRVRCFKTYEAVVQIQIKIECLPREGIWI